MNPQTLYNQSLALLDGDGVQKDLTQSFKLNAEAAQSGHHDAVLAMGWYYLNGFGVLQDIDKAKSWYKKSARQGEAMAMFSLGQIAYEERDYADAMQWFKRAAKAGHYRSIFWIGKLHWHGRGVPQDKKQAMRMFNEAATKKVKEARRTLKWLSKK